MTFAPDGDVVSCSNQVSVNYAFHEWHKFWAIGLLQNIF